jgi:flavin reductase (DIM6/NTAB) family NADH-FMN oxidoreductase RutF
LDKKSSIEEVPVMEKIRIDNKARLFPMPMVVVGAVVEDKINYLAVAWVCRVNPDPPLIGVALGKGHHTNKGIREHKEFGISIPGQDLVRAVDYVGLVSGVRTDKSKVFESFQGQLPYAPMIRNCPLSAECRWVTTVDLPGNEFFIGEMVGVYTEERYLTEGKPDFEKIRPFLLTMPDNAYREVGKIIGSAWNIGKNFEG